MPIVGVVADANALLSAIVGKAALRVITEFNIETHVSQFNVEEVAEYLPRMSKKYGLPVALVELQWKLLPLHIHTVSDYESLLPRAIADMKRRDPKMLTRWLWPALLQSLFGRMTEILIT